MKKLIRKIKNLSVHSLPRTIGGDIVASTFLLMGLLIFLVLVVLWFSMHVIFPKLALLGLPLVWIQFFLISILMAWMIREIQMFLALIEPVKKIMGNSPYRALFATGTYSASC